MNTLIVLTRFDESRSYLIVREGDYRHLNGLELSTKTMNQYFPKNVELYNLICDEDGFVITNGYNLSTDHCISLDLLKANDIEFIIFCRST